jgi:hypothetical protein
VRILPGHHLTLFHTSPSETLLTNMAGTIAHLVLTFTALLNLLCATAHPNVTPTPSLEKRQYLGASTVWSPFIVGTSISCISHY